MSEGMAHEVAQLRCRLGISAVQLGKLCGVTSNTVHKWESGFRNPPLPCRIIMEQLEDPKLMKWHLQRIKREEMAVH